MADNIKIEWKGDKYADRLQRNVQQAIERSVEKVRTATMKALSVGGQKGKGLAKLNTVSGKMSDEARTAKKIARGEALMGGSLKQFKSKSGKLNVRHGGSFTHTDKSGATETYDRVYWYGEPVNKWVTASRPGDPPHRQTNDGLRARIWYEFSSDGLSAKVGPLDKIKYARRQELGGPGSFPARPYLRPSFLACKPKIIDMIKDAAEKAGKA